MSYKIAGSRWFDNANEWNFLTPYYYSIVTFSTLGFGDIHPKVGCWEGQLMVMIEVLLGYLALGALLSIFAHKFARRS